MLWLVVLAGCGRIAFEPFDPIDAEAPFVCTAPLVGHDEDGDGFDDGCDPCPHVVEVTQRDRDHDGVGDACDPHPTEARDRIALFDAFASLRPEWMLSGGTIAMVRNDQLTGSAPVGAASRAILPLSTGMHTLQFAAHVSMAIGPPQQVKLFADTPTAAYLCEIYEDVGVQKFGLSYTLDGSNIDSIASAPTTIALDPSSFTLTMVIEPPNVTCLTTMPATASRLESPIPGSIVGTNVLVLIGGVTFALDYFIDIASD